MIEEQAKKMKERLEATRDEILKVINLRDQSTDSREGQDEIDQAKELIELELGSLMSDNMNANLKEVDEAFKDPSAIVAKGLPFDLYKM